MLTRHPDLYPGDEDWNRFSRRSSLIFTTFQNQRGITLTHGEPPDANNPDHIKFVKDRQLQLDGKKRIELYAGAPGKRPSFFQCINPARFNPSEYDYPACRCTHFADWNEVIECECGFLYQWKDGGIYRIFERPDESEPDDGDWEYFNEPD